MQQTWIRSLSWEDPLEEGMATHSNILAWRIQWTEDPGGLQSMELQRVRHNWATNTHTHTHTHTPFTVLLPLPFSYRMAHSLPVTFCATLNESKVDRFRTALPGLWTHHLLSHRPRPRLPLPQIWILLPGQLIFSNFPSLPTRSLSLFDYKPTEGREHVNLSFTLSPSHCAQNIVGTD